MPQKFTGTQKAAILLMQAGKERASAVLRGMREQEVAEIMAEVARLHHLEVNEIEEVLTEFQDIYTARSQIAKMPCCKALASRKRELKYYNM